MSDAPTPTPPAPAPSPTPPASAPTPPGQGPVFKNRGGVALVVGLAIVGLGVYVLQPSQPGGPALNQPNFPNSVLNNPAKLANRGKMVLNPAQVEAIRAARASHKGHPEIGPDGKVVMVTNAPQRPMPEGVREQVVAAAAQGAGPQANGEVSRNEIQTAVRMLMPAMHSCYEQGLKQKADLGGTVTVAFTLHRDTQGGSYAKEGEVADSTLAAPLVEACMLEQINRAKFPEIKGEGEVKVRYPFKLSRDGEPAKENHP